ncbi:heavy metal transport/detoxification protein [Candidatus Nitrosoglobus terrae]|uniref:Heavy metal transport/detoxification protein n=1 Tax=Candidatus Nitrosoglobus terrae TaxID=1630141 RepID=A0A1Q2SK11_9GAMM|nr:heavy metal-associated domain-containing protein [Candidatus Nitrosoglobus terrae]BAW79458.1 heavy metal transport/detoxification protein [Candidatus Nitrosoglobus terrae]
MEKTYKVDGMTCNGCAKSVERAITTAATTAIVKVNLEKKQITVTGIDDDVLIAQAVEAAGFDYEGPVLS